MPGELVVGAVAVAVVVLVLATLLETVAAPKSWYDAAGQPKWLWVALALLTGVIGAGLWFAVGRAKVRAGGRVAEKEAAVAARRDLAPSPPGVLDSTPHEPGAPKPDPILVVDNVYRRFGGLTAVDVDHVEFQRGCITALIGPNGAGKTTLFNLLTGFDEPDGGNWTFEGRPMSGVPAHRVAQYGMVRTFQLTKALSKLTVLDNMMLGAARQRGEHIRAAMLRGMWDFQEAEVRARAEQLLERFKLSHMRDEYAASLSGGQRKLLEMARALMAEPRLVMLDEPMAGVNPALTQSLLGHVKDLRAEGMSVIFVEHDMDVVHDISDWVVVMALGKVIAEGPPDAISANPEVIDAYLGSHHDAPTTAAEAEARLAEAVATIQEEELA